MINDAVTEANLKQHFHVCFSCHASSIIEVALPIYSQNL